MATVKPYLITKNSGIRLDVKCVKAIKGKEEEALFSCKVYYKNKHFADYEESDWSLLNDNSNNDAFANITIVNQDVYDNAMAIIDALPTYKSSKTNTDLTIDLTTWINAACIYKTIESQAKREKNLSYFCKKLNCVRIIKKTKDFTVEQIKDHISTMIDIVPFHDLEQEKVTEYYLKEYDISF